MTAAAQPLDLSLPADAGARRLSETRCEYVQVPGTALLGDHALPR